MPHRILVVGGCYAGLAAAINLLDLCEGRAPRFSSNTQPTEQKLQVEITIVDERDGFYHVIGSPLALASSAYAQKAWVRFADIPGLQHPAIKVVHGSITKVDPDARTATITASGSAESFQHEYDYLVAASGLRRVWPVVPQQLTREGYLKEAEGHIKVVKHAENGVVVIGGGAVGIEMAAELKAVEPKVKVTLIHSRDRLLSSEPLPDEFKDETLSLLRSVDVQVITGKRVESQAIDEDSRTTTLTLSDRSTLTASCVINAISRSVPTTTYLPPSTLDSEGYVKIKASLHFHDDYHFAAGDIALWSGIKRCGAAMHMGNYCAHNIHQHILSVTSSSSRPSSLNDIGTRHVPQYKELTEHVPVIGIAIGTTCATYSPSEGVKSGPEVLQYMFGDDLGFNNCYNYMQLGQTPGLGNESTHAAPTELEVSDKIPDEGVEERETTPALSATSTSSEADVEAQTPLDAGGDAMGTDVEASGKILGDTREVAVERIVNGIGRSSIRA